MSGSIYSAESLFGPAPAGLALLSHAPFLERAVRGEGESGSAVALAAYSLGRLVDRWLERAGNPAAHIEIPAEIAALRAQLDELPESCGETPYLAAIVESLGPDVAGDSSLPARLMAYARFLEVQGRLEEALDAVALAARAHGARVPPGQFTAAALAAGRLNRLLARWSEATGCYQAAERAAREQDDFASALRGRLGLSIVARGQGNLPAARAIAETVQHEASIRSLPEVEAMAWADLAAALSELGMPVEALNADYHAFLLTEDPVLHMQTLGNVGVDLLQLGAYDAARTAFMLVARSEEDVLMRLNALLELMSLECAAGDQTAFEHSRSIALSARHNMPPSMEVDFLFKTGAGLARFGQPAGAGEALREALAIAEHRGLHAWYFRIEQALRDLKQRVEHRLPEAPFASFRESPVVREVAAGLRQYAAPMR